MFDLGIDHLSVPHRRLHKLEFDPVPRLPGEPVFREEKSGVGRHAEF